MYKFWTLFYIYGKTPQHSLHSSKLDYMVTKKGPHSTSHVKTQHEGKERTQTIGRDKDNIKDQKQIWTDKDKTRQNYPYSTSHTDRHLNIHHLNRHYQYHNSSQTYHATHLYQ